MSCDYNTRCLNNTKCGRCFNHTLLKLPEDKWKSKNNKNTNRFNKTKCDDKESWKDLEQQVADKLNRVPTMTEARRSIMSGALWFETGDVQDSILHPECKERQGNTLKTGEKSMSIKKDWLEKATNECKFNKKTMVLPFRFKNDENIYAIMEFDNIAELVTTMKAYMYDNEVKDKEIKLLKEKLGIL